MELAAWKKTGIEPFEYFESLALRLKSDARPDASAASFAAMAAAYEGLSVTVPGLLQNLLVAVEKGGPERTAASWALVWLTDGFDTKKVKPSIEAAKISSTASYSLLA